MRIVINKNERCTYPLIQGVSLYHKVGQAPEVRHTKQLETCLDLEALSRWPMSVSRPFAQVMDPTGVVEPLHAAVIVSERGRLVLEAEADTGTAVACWRWA